MMAAGSAAAVPDPSACVKATYSSPAMAMRVGPVAASRGASASRGPGKVDARTAPPIAKAMSAPVSALNCAARRSSSR